MLRDARTADEEGPEAFAVALARRLDEVGEIDPVALADLFSCGFDRSPYGAAVAAEVRAFLVRRTLAHARAHAPYYRDRAVYAGETAWDALPTIDRAAVSAAGADFLADDVHLRSVCHTSGTTGQPLEVYKSHEEIRFIGACFSRLIAPLLAGERSLSLSFPSVHHGVPIPMPSPNIVFVGGMSDDTLIRDAHRVLATPYVVDGKERRISALSGFGYQLIFFTNYLLEQKVDPAGFGLAAISVAGGFLPDYWREFLEKSWGCPVHDRYSLTEGVGGATRCHGCGLFRPDLQVLFEAVDIDTGAPVAAGIGKLLVTNLYPFAQMMPLIRYETGDLVRVGACACGGGAPMAAFEFLGRYRNCISAGTGAGRRWLLFSAKLNNLLTAVPDLNLYEWFSNVRVAKDRTVGSLPIMALTHEVGADGRITIRIEVELRYSPYTRADRVAALTRTLTEDLSACAGTALGEALADGSAELDIEFLPPGGFEGEYMIKI